MGVKALLRLTDVYCKLRPRSSGNGDKTVATACDKRFYDHDAFAGKIRKTLGDQAFAVFA